MHWCSEMYFVIAQYIRELYWQYEYEEVVTPNIYNFDLWKTSGHADHYKENMFLINIEKQEFGLKPMNCPGAQPIFRKISTTFEHCTAVLTRGKSAVMSAASNHPLRLLSSMG